MFAVELCKIPASAARSGVMKVTSPPEFYSDINLVFYVD